MISIMVPLTLMTPYDYTMYHEVHLFVTKHGQQLLNNMFLEIFNSVTSYFTENIISWTNE
jgi:hypothetical protein